MADKLTRTQLKRAAQDALMHGVGNVLGYAETNVPATQIEEFHTILKREADRVARLFGYEEAWSN